MPRSRKQPIAEIPSPSYGQGEKLQQMQRETPLDQLRTLDGMPTAPPSDVGGPMEMAAQFVNPTGVPPGAPTARPNEPRTAGLAVGPGPGPEALGRTPRRNATADILEQLGSVSGDSVLMARASRIRNQGG